MCHWKYGYISIKLGEVVLLIAHPPNATPLLCDIAYFHQLGPLGRVGLVVDMSVCLSVCVSVPFPCDFF